MGRTGHAGEPGSWSLPHSLHNYSATKNSVLVSNQMKYGARGSTALANCFSSLEQKIAFQMLAFVRGQLGAH
jgi:hypothetical protein